MDNEECFCEETETNGEQICDLCKARWAAESACEADRETNRLLHYITGGDFL